MSLSRGDFMCLVPCCPGRPTKLGPRLVLTWQFLLLRCYLFDGKAGNAFDKSPTGHALTACCKTPSYAARTWSVLPSANNTPSWIRSALSQSLRTEGRECDT